MFFNQSRCPCESIRVTRKVLSSSAAGSKLCVQYIVQERLTNSPDPAPALDPCTFFIISLGALKVFVTPSLRSGILISRSGFARRRCKAAACCSAGVALRASLVAEGGRGVVEPELLPAAAAAAASDMRVQAGGRSTLISQYKSPSCDGPWLEW